MEKWSVNDVYEWIKETLNLPDLAQKMREECVDGETLRSYEINHLCSDYDLKLGPARKVLYEVQKWSTKSNSSSKVEPSKQLDQVEHLQNVLTTSIPQNPSDGSPSSPVDSSLLLEHKQEMQQDIQTLLNKLITGTEKGRLTTSFFPILVTNQPPQLTDECPENFDERFGVFGNIEWTAVFDCYNQSDLNGLCMLAESKRKVKKLIPNVFTEIQNVEKFQSEIGFSYDTPWIFCNGRAKLKDEPLYDRREWSKKRSKNIQDAISFFANSSVIPGDRVVIIFMLLSEESIGILADIWFMMYSAFHGTEKITVICKDESLHRKFTKETQKWISAKEMYERSIVGRSWQDVQKAMMKLAWLPRWSDYLLPCRDPKGAMATYCLTQRQMSEFTDLEILPANECSDENLQEGTDEFEDKKFSEEFYFYRGNKVSWWNFAFSDSKYNKGFGYNQVLRRQCQMKLDKLLKRCLATDPNHDTYDDTNMKMITTITIFHEPGSGGSTVARQVLWDLHEKFRCCVVKNVTANTIDQILQLKKIGYQSNNLEDCLPVIVLLEDFDTQEITYIVEEMEFVCRELSSKETLCVFLYCKRTTTPSLWVIDAANELSVEVTHELQMSERKWFQDKLKELEMKKQDYNLYEPERLLAFMVMKEECSSTYLKEVVHKVLKDVLQGANSELEMKLLLYIALLSSYDENFSMPLSCCDELMRDPFVTPTRRTKKVNWEENLSDACRMLLTQNEVFHENGRSSAFKIVHLKLSHEILNQILEWSKQDLCSAMIDLLHSSVLSKGVFMTRYMKHKIHDIFTRRKKIEHGSEKISDFSAIIQDLHSDGPEKALKVLQEGFKVLEDPYVGQQLARFFSNQRQYEDAQMEIDRSLQLSNAVLRAFLLDTKAQIFVQQIQVNFDRKYKQRKENLGANEARTLLELAFNAMDVFTKAQDVVLEQNIHNYTGFGSLARLAFLLLDIICTCVYPFSQENGKSYLQNYILYQQIPTEVEVPWKNYHEKLFSLPSRVSESLHILEEFRTYYKSKSNSAAAQQGLEKIVTIYQRLLEAQKYYFGCKPETVSNENVSRGLVSIVTLRRYEAIGNGVSSFHKIFDLASTKTRENMEKLRKTKTLLMKNGDEMNYKDLLNVIFISLATASFDPQYDCNSDDEETVYRLVESLCSKANDDDKFSALLKVMMLWPREGSKVTRGREKELMTAVRDLKYRWNKKNKSDAYSEEATHSKKYPKTNRKLRGPQTHFFLAKDKGLRAFVHVKELHIGQIQLEIPKAQFWGSNLVANRLKLLKGMLISQTHVSCQLSSENDIKIKIAHPWGKIRDQDEVTFYIGFSFEGPLAFNVTDKHARSAPVRPFQGSLPLYIRDGPRQIHITLRKQKDLLIERGAAKEELDKLDEQIYQWQLAEQRLQSEEF